MDLEYIEQLARLVGGTSVSEVTVRRGERGITLRRQPGTTEFAVGVGAGGETDLSTDVTPLALTTGALLPMALGSEGAVTVSGEPAEPATEILLAHRVGYFRRARAEQGEHLVQVGDWVAAGQQLGSIESMKVFDEVDASVGGRILGVFVEDGDPVEFGQSLFHIEICDEPDGSCADSPEETDEP
ncbi:MAG: hypothetical protein HZB16_07540 [Armatimonadetes bacterium]|nr:hypothetical protein [Armatimonadota bacterium]